MPSFLKYIKVLRKQTKKFPGTSFWGSLKYYKLWSASITNDKNVLPELPWMTYPAIDFLSSNVENQMIVFEFGSGSSTLFWAKNVQQVFSVEHDNDWAENMKKELSKRKIGNVQLFFIPPVKSESVDIDIADPYKYRTDDEALRQYSFEDYVKKIGEYPDDHFDYVVVDGRARPSCIAASINKIKVGGYMVVDNSEREYYFEKTINMLQPEKWQRIDFCGPIPGEFHFSQTSFFKKLS